MVESVLRKSHRVKPPIEVDENQRSPVKKQQQQHHHEQQSPPQQQHSISRRTSSRRKRPVAVHHKNSSPTENVAELEKELMENVLSRRQRRSSALGHTCLDSIKNHKNIIAEMRPTRRKIKWQNNISDWERSSNMNQKNNKKTSRISVGLNLEDLHIHGAPKEPDEEQQLNETSMLDLGCNLVDADSSVDELEDTIELLFATIRRLSNEVDELDEESDNLRAQHQTIRKQLVNLPIPQTPSRRRTCQQLTHTVDRLKEKTCEMEEQITLLNLQRVKTENATAALLLQLAAERVKAAAEADQGKGLTLDEEDGDSDDYSDDDDDNDDYDDIGDDNQELDQDDDKLETSSAAASSASEASEILSVDKDHHGRSISEFSTLEYLQYFGMEVSLSGRRTASTTTQHHHHHHHNRGGPHHHKPSQHRSNHASPRMINATPAAA